MKYVLLFAFVLFFSGVAMAQEKKQLSDSEFAEAKRQMAEMRQSPTVKTMERIMRTFFDKVPTGFFSEYSKLYHKRTSATDFYNSALSKLNEEKPVTKFSSKQEVFYLIMDYLKISKQVHAEFRDLDALLRKATVSQRLDVYDTGRGITMPRLSAAQMNKYRSERD